MRKRMLSMFLVLCMISTYIVTVPVTVSAATSGRCGDNLTWTLDDGGMLTISGTGDMYDWDWTDVPWYSYGSEIKTVEILSGVTSIGDYAFVECYGITSITLPDSVTSIGDYAFVECYGITSITLPDSVTSIGDYAFYYCYGLTSITIPDSVTSIEDFAFSGCDGLTSVTIGNSVTSIGNSAFRSCSGLTSITIPDSVTSIGDCAFSDCSNMTYINVKASNANYIDMDGVLYTNDKKKLINYPAGRICSEYVIPDSVTSIGASAFSSCSGLTSVTIGNSVTSIGNSAFRYCSGLTSITIPDSVTSIGDGAFSDCSNMTYINVKASNANYIDIDGVLYTKDKKKLINYPAGRICSEYVIPDSVTSIGDYAFRDCSGLTSITIPDSVTSIGDGAFYWCDGLTSVTIGNSVTSMGDYAFGSCNELTSVTIRNGVTTIGDGAFSSCDGITSIKIPDSVTSIGDYAFYYCYGLTSVTIGNSVTSIGDGAFVGCYGLTSITIPDSVTSIGDYAFYYCDGLTDVYYKGSESDWNNIDIGGYNECLTNANIHFNHGKNPGVEQNTDIEIKVESDPSHMPAEINNVTINGKGTAYGRFKIMNKDGSVAKNTKVAYSVDGSTKKVVKTNEYGYATIEVAGIKSSRDYNISFTGNSIPVTNGVLSVTVEPLNFKSKMEAVFTRGASVGIGIGAGLEIVSVKAEAKIADAEAEGEITNTLSLEHEYVNNKNKISIDTETNYDIGITGKVGLFAEAGKEGNFGAKASLIDANAGAKYAHTVGLSYKNDDFSFSDSNDINGAARFILASALSSMTYNILSNYIIEKLNAPVKSVEHGNLLSVSAGANVGVIEAGVDGVAEGEIAIAGVGADAVYTHSTKKNEDSSKEYTSGISADVDYKFFDVGIKMADTVKMPSLIKIGESLGGSMSVSATKDKNGTLTSLSYQSKGETASNRFLRKTTETDICKIEYENEAAQNVAASYDKLNKFIAEKKAFFTKSQMKNTLTTFLDNDETGKVSYSRDFSDGFGIDLSAKVKLFLSIGGKLGISGATGYEYEEESGIIEKGTIYMQAKNDIKDDVASKAITIDNLVNATQTAMNNMLSSFMQSAKKVLSDVGESVVEAGQAVVKKAKSTGKKIVVSISNLIESVGTLSILAVEDELALFSTSSLATTIGEPYIISVEDESGNVIDDFSDEPLLLTLSYTQEQLDAAGVTDTNEIAVVKWDDDKGVYVKLGGTLDSANSCMNIEITKPGQYILAVDNCPPAVTVFETNNMGGSPVVSAIVSDMSGISDFSFRIDGSEMVNFENIEDYYDFTTGKFKYQTASLSNGTHTALIYAADSFGNTVEETLEFTVDTTLPVIKEVSAVPEIITEDTYVTAKVECDNILSVLLNAETVSPYGEVSGMSISMVEENGVYSGKIPSIPSGYSARVWVSAYSASGNSAESEPSKTVSIPCENGKTSIAVTSIFEDKVTVKCAGYGNVQKGVVCLGIYDADGRLMRTEYKPVSESVTFEGITEKGTVRAYLWEDMITMNPVSKIFELPYVSGVSYSWVQIDNKSVTNTEVTATLINNSEELMHADVYTAVYDSTGKLENVYITEAELEPGREYDYSQAIDKTNTSYASVFVWKHGTMLPL